MSKIIIAILIMSSSSIMAWDTFCGNVKMCDEYANFQVTSGSFGPWSGTKIEQIVQNAANWWNEAGSEHHLYYDGVGSTGAHIEWESFFLSDNDVAGRTTWVTTTAYCGGCIITSSANIDLNSNYWNASGDYKTTSQVMKTVVTHEMGHLLGVDHTQETYSTYRAILMQEEYFWTSHITEDDKYGARFLYGKDDEQIMTGISNGSNADINTSNIRWFESEDNFESYSQPQLAYIPNSIYDNYLAVWVNPTTRRISYSKAYDCGSINSDLCNSELRTLNSSSETLTAPSVAVSSDGAYAIIIWKQEIANYSYIDADNIWIAKINLSTDSVVYTSLSNMDRTGSKPIVKWTDAWGGRFVIFFSSLDSDNNDEENGNWPNWRLNYIISDDNYILNSTSYGGNIALAVDWNPMGITCNLPDNQCMILYNAPGVTDREDGTLIEIGKQRVVLLEPIGNSYPSFIKETNSYNNLIQGIEGLPKNYGHYSVSSRFSHWHFVWTPWGYFPDYPIYRVVTTFMPKAAKQQIHIAYFYIWNDNYDIWQNSTIQYNNYGTVSSTGARTGHSVVWNAAKQFYRYFWIRE